MSANAGIAIPIPARRPGTDADLVPWQTVPAEAFAGERARRRAVEGLTKAGFPAMAKAISIPRPTVTLESTRDGLARLMDPARFVRRWSDEMEVIREPF